MELITNGLLLLLTVTPMELDSLIQLYRSNIF